MFRISPQDQTSIRGTEISFLRSAMVPFDCSVINAARCDEKCCPQEQSDSAKHLQWHVTAIIFCKQGASDRLAHQDGGGNDQIRYTHVLAQSGDIRTDLRDERRDHGHESPRRKAVQCSEDDVRSVGLSRDPKG